MMTKPNHDQLFQIAKEQAGYFTAAQARYTGFSWERLSNSVKSGKFQRVARGVYRLSHFPGSRYEDLFIAWLVTRQNSVIFHESALALYELSDVLPGDIHLIVPRTASRRRKGIRLHTNRLEPDEIASRSGLPLTTVARTIADVIGSGIAEEQVRLAIQDALQRGLVSKDELAVQAERRGVRAKKVIQVNFHEVQLK